VKRTWKTKANAVLGKNWGQKEKDAFQKTGIAGADKKKKRNSEWMEGLGRVEGKGGKDGVHRYS